MGFVQGDDQSWGDDVAVTGSLWRLKMAARQTSNRTIAEVRAIRGL